MQDRTNKMREVYSKRIKSQLLGIRIIGYLKSRKKLQKSDISNPLI